MSASERFDTPLAMRIEFKTELAQLPPLAERWEALNNRASDHDAPFFQSYAWNYYVAQVRARASAGAHALLVATVWRGDDLIGIWPLAITRSAGLRIARSLDDPFGQLAGVSFLHAADIAPGVTKILATLREQADALQIEGVIAGSALHTALLQHGAVAASGQQSVFVDLRPYPTFKAFEESVKSSTRKTLRKRAEKLRQTHEGVEATVVEDRARLDTLLRDIFHSRLKWLQDSGKTSPAFRDTAFNTLITGLVHVEGMELIGFSIATRLASVSAQWGFTYAGRFYAYMSSKNADYDEFSPGRLLYRMVIETCFGRGVHVLELMPPAGQDKLEWSGAVKQVDTMVMPFTAKGRVGLFIAHRLMPAARRLSKSLPDFVRKPLIRRLNKT